MDCYVLDADTVINLQSHFPAALRKLRTLAAQGLVKMPAGTYREVTHKSDKVGKLLPEWAEKYPQFVVRFDKRANPRLRQELARIE